MKHTKLTVVLVVLLAAGLGVGCGAGSPTAPCLTDNGDPNWRVPPGYVPPAHCPKLEIEDTQPAL